MGNFSGPGGTDPAPGRAACGAGDLNGDGFGDVIVGRLHSHVNGLFSGSILVIHGAADSEFSTQFGDLNQDQFGFSVSDAGDVNQDGFDDIIVGAPSDDITGVRVHSGLDGSLLMIMDGNNQFDGFGATVDLAGDVDGDSFPDFLVGRNNLDNNLGGTTTGAASGSVHIRSGRDGKELVFADTQVSDIGFGASISSVGDLNADNIQTSLPLRLWPTQMASTREQHLSFTRRLFLFVATTLI